MKHMAIVAWYKNLKDSERSGSLKPVDWDNIKFMLAMLTANGYSAWCRGGRREPVFPQKVSPDDIMYIDRNDPERGFTKSRGKIVLTNLGEGMYWYRSSQVDAYMNGSIKSSLYLYLEQEGVYDCCQRTYDTKKCY